MPPNATTARERTDGRPTITGPHTGVDRYGRPDHTYYRYEACGWDTCDETIQQRGCPNCGAGGEEAR